MNDEGEADAAESRLSHTGVRLPYSYRAFGLGVRSEIALPELLEADVPGDILVRIGRDGAPDGAGPPPSAGFARLRLDGVGTLWVREGREIVVDPALGARAEALRLLILGTGFGMALHQRGVLVLHASAVEMDGRAVAFLGDKGRGKSTLAAALHARGCPLVTDDLLALSVAPQGALLAWPSYPHVKLWPASLPAAGLDGAGLPLVHPGVPKRGWRLASGAFAATPLPLGGLFVLEVGEEVSVDPMPRMQAFDQLMRHAYVEPFVRPTGTERQLLRHSAAVAAGVPVARLTRTEALSDLALLLETVGRYVRQGA